MINVNQLTSQLAMMPDTALQKYAAMHKNDPYTVSLALAESNRRKDIRAGAQAQPGQQPKVVDQEIAQMKPAPVMAGAGTPVAAGLPEDSGIGQLPAKNLQKMAGGGIVAFEEGGEVDRYQNKGVTESHDGPEQYRAYALKKAEEMGLDPIWVDRIFSHESKTKRSPMGYDPEAVSPTGATGIGQLVKNTANHYMRKVGHLGQKEAFDPEMRKDPYKNIDASLAYMVDLKNKYNGDPSLMAVGYNQGEPYLDKHLKENNGQLNPAALKDEPKNYLRQTVEKLIPSAEAATPSKPKDQGPAAGETLSQDGKYYVDSMGIPTRAVGTAGGQSAPRVEKPADLMSDEWFMNKAENLGLDRETGRNVYNTMMAPTPLLPASTLPKTGGLLSRATSGLASLGEKVYDKIVPSGKMSEEGIAALKAEKAAQAAAQTTKAAQEAGATLEEQQYLRNMAEANRLKNAPSAAEKIQNASLAREAGEAQAMQNAAKTAQNVQVGQQAGTGLDMGLEALANSGEAGVEKPTAETMPLDTNAISAIRDRAGASDAGAAESPAAGGLAGLFKDPAFLMGLRLMSSQNPRLLGAVGEAGIGTVGDMAAAEKAASEAALKKGEGRYYSAYADAMERGAKEKNMSLEAEKLVQQHMEKWNASPAGQLAGLKDASASQAEEARARNAIYQQLGISPTMGAAPAPNTSGFKLLGVR